MTMPPIIEEPAKAIRLARAIASDIAVYNEDKIKEGIMNDTLFDVLSEEIAEGRALYQSRVGEAVRSLSNFYDRALVDVIMRGKAHIQSPIW